MIAILLNPLCNRIERKLQKVIAILLSMTIAFVALAALMYFLSSQVAHFFDDLESIKARLNDLLHDLQVWVQQAFGISAREQPQTINEAANSNKGMIG